MKKDIFQMHIVHYSDRFQKIEDAIDKPDGLLVLGFFFEVNICKFEMNIQPYQIQYLFFLVNHVIFNM